LTGYGPQLTLPLTHKGILLTKQQQMFEHISRIIPFETAITILIITLLITFIQILFAGKILDHYMAKKEKARINRQPPAENFFQPLAPPPHIELQMGDAPRAFDGLPLAKQFSAQGMIFNEKDMSFWQVLATNALRTAGVGTVIQAAQANGQVPANIPAGHDMAVYTAITNSILSGDQRDWFMRNVAKFADSGHKLWHALLAEFGQTNIGKVQTNMSGCLKRSTSHQQLRSSISGIPTGISTPAKSSPGSQQNSNAIIYTRRKNATQLGRPTHKNRPTSCNGGTQRGSRAAKAINLLQRAPAHRQSKHHGGNADSHGRNH
jgi:hypothetical protein